MVDFDHLFNNNLLSHLYIQYQLCDIKHQLSEFNTLARQNIAKHQVVDGVHHISHHFHFGSLLPFCSCNPLNAEPLNVCSSSYKVKLGLKRSQQHMLLFHSDNAEQCWSPAAMQNLGGIRRLKTKAFCSLPPLLVKDTAEGAISVSVSFTRHQFSTTCMFHTAGKKNHHIWLCLNLRLTSLFQSLPLSHTHTDTQLPVSDCNLNLHNKS